MTLPEIPDEWSQTVEHLWRLAPPMLLDAGWHTVAWEFDDELRLYVDGQAVI